MSHSLLKQKVEELDRLNLELYRACRSAHTLLESKSRNAGQIEEILRLAMNKAERYQDLQNEVDHA